MEYIKEKYSKYGWKTKESIEQISIPKGSYLLGSSLFFLLGYTSKEPKDIDIYAPSEGYIEGYDLVNNPPQFIPNISFTQYNGINSLSIEDATYLLFKFKYNRKLNIHGTNVEDHYGNYFKAKRGLYLLEVALNLYKKGEVSFLKKFKDDDHNFNLEKDLKEENFYNIIQYIIHESEELNVLLEVL